MKAFDILRKVRQLGAEERAATAVEYAVMLTILVAVMLSAIRVLGPIASDVYMDTSNAVTSGDDQ